MCERISWLIFLLGKLKARLQSLHVLISAFSAEIVAKLVDLQAQVKSRPS